MSPTVYEGPLCSGSLFHISANETGDQVHTNSLIGIAVAVGGNILISLALNCQKLAHKRLDLEKQRQREFGELSHCGSTRAENDQVSLTDARDPMSDETRLFLGGPYDSYTTPQNTHSRFNNVLTPRDAESPRQRSAHVCSPITVDSQDEEVPAVAIEVTIGEGCGTGAKHSDDRTISEEDVDVEHNETDYLRSKLWCVYFIDV